MVRWVVERTVSWAKGRRRMRVRYDRLGVIRDASTTRRPVSSASGSCTTASCSEPPWLTRRPDDYSHGATATYRLKK